MWQIRKPKDQSTPEEVAERTEEDRRLMTTGDAGAFSHNDLHTDLKVELHQQLLGLINLSALETMSREQIEDEETRFEVAEAAGSKQQFADQRHRPALADQVHAMSRSASIVIAPFFVDSTRRS